MSSNEEPEKKQDSDDTWPDVMRSQYEQQGKLEPLGAAWTTFVYDDEGKAVRTIASVPDGANDLVVHQEPSCLIRDK